MTADERIEKLLNRFGQTIEDLPNPKDYDWSRSAYDDVHLQSAKKAAYVWMWDEYQDADVIPMDEIEPPLCDYICHLADIIDRMEIALETGLRILRILSCFPCDKEDDCNRLSCDFRIDDYYLTDDISKKDAERYIDDAD